VESNEQTANVAAETGIALFRIAFARWVDRHNSTGLEDLMTSALHELRTLAAPR
jgi:hypothetical protein